MKRIMNFIALLCLTTQIIAQNTSAVLKAFTIIEQRKVELNGGLRASMGGKSRTFLKIDLPPNTKEWYYSFTTTESESGTSKINLALQLSTLLLDPTGLTSAAAKAVNIAKGTSSADIYLCDRNNIELFNQKTDLQGGRYRYIMEGTVENTAQATVRIDDVTQGTWYIGLKNPSSMDGINVFIDVVAIVEEKVIKQKTAEEQKADMYGNMGWKAYERGDYDKSLEFSTEAIRINPELGWVHNNIGLVKLIKGDLTNAIESYSRAITFFKKDPSPKRMFEAAITDLNNLTVKHGALNGASDLIDMLTVEYKGYK